MSSAVEFYVNTGFFFFLLFSLSCAEWDSGFLQPWMPTFEKVLINHALLSFDCINYSEGYRFIVEVLDAKQNIPTWNIPTASCENFFL